MKKPLIAILFILGIAAIAYSQRNDIVGAVLQKGIAARISSDMGKELGDGLHLALCGAGGPLAAPKASGPCVAVIAGDRLFIVDSGTDGVRNLTRMGYQPGSIQAVFLTHFHSDHIDGLGEMGTLRWAGGDNPVPLPVFGPAGVESVVDGFNAAYSQDFTYRNAHHGDSIAPLSGAGLRAMSFAQPAIGELTSVYEEAGLVVEALAVDHAPISPAVGYRFRYRGRSLLITGDTVKLANIEQFARGVDLLVHEALAPNLVGMMHDAAEDTGNRRLLKITDDILDYHTSPIEAAETARDADVGHLLYYHIVPPLVLPGQKALFLNGAEQVFPDYTIGEDGTTFSLPADSSEIVLRSEGL